jgi:hypothetical protein
MSEQPKTTIDLGINFNSPILGMENEEIQSTNPEDGLIETLRLGDVCINALMATLPDDNADGIQKLRRFSLAKKIKGKVDEDYQLIHINSKSKTLILDMAAKVYSSLIYGRMHEALEGTTETEEA